VESSVWATQHHNEGILDQAFQTSKDIYLIFSANKSGEFFGYARMAGPIRPGERRMSWTSRSESLPASSSKPRPPFAFENSNIEERLAEAEVTLPAVPLLSPSEHRMASSPSVLTPEEDLAEADLHVRSKLQRNPIITTEPQPAHAKLSFSLLEREHGTLDPRNLDIRTVPVPASLPQPSLNLASRFDQGKLDSDGVVRRDTLVTVEQNILSSEQPSIESREGGDHNKSTTPGAVGGTRFTLTAAQKEAWGNPFPIEWLRTDKLSFQRTRHLRNPWNHDREVKVSRDGTELEPSVGEALLAEWEKIRTLTPPPATSEEPAA